MLKWPTKKLEGLIEERSDKNFSMDHFPVFTVLYIYGLIPYHNIFLSKITY